MEQEANPQETASLKHLALVCSQQLQELSRIETDQQENIETGDRFWASRQFADFNLWCANTGITSEGRRSIDVRLKDVPEICKILQQLLQSLHSDLTELLAQNARPSMQIVETEDSIQDVYCKSDADSLTYDSLSSSEGSQSQLGMQNEEVRKQPYELELKRHVGDTTDRLQGQARRIERAAACHRRERVDLYREKTRPRQVYEGYQKLGAWKANQQFKLASEVIKNRMAESFARRRIRFEYLKEHQKKRSIGILSLPNKIPAPLVQNNTTVDLVPILQTEEGSKMPIKTSAMYSSDQQTLFSATVNTQYNLPPEPKKKERAESVKSIALPQTGFPPPPQIRLGKFQCPYCILEYRDSEAEIGRWR